MEQRPDPNTSSSPLSPRLVVASLVVAGLLALVFQVNRLLSSSFRIELFGQEIVQVDNLKANEARHTHRRHDRRVRRPPAAPRRRAEAEVLEVAEQMPELIGGLASVARQIRYPEVARKAGIEGRVIVQFIVDERGRVAQPRVVRGIGGGCDAEALRVVQRLRFTPGQQDGRNVKVRMSLPITFRL